MSDLGDFHDALTAIAEERERRRKAFSDGLETRTYIHVERSDGDPWWSYIAWFRSVDGDHFMAFRHYANGFEDRPCNVLATVLVRKLAETL